MMKNLNHLNRILTNLSLCLTLHVHIFYFFSKYSDFFLQSLLFLLLIRLLISKINQYMIIIRFLLQEFNR